MDRSIVTDMVEDHWRTLIPVMQNGGLSAALAAGERFEQRMQQTADLMEPIEGAAFVQALNEERERITAEYVADRVSLKLRLGISLGNDEPQPVHVQQGGGLGELAVRTAVRATVWEGVWALFRVFR